MIGEYDKIIRVYIAVLSASRRGQSQSHFSERNEKQEMKKSIKRIFSVILVLVLMLSVAPRPVVNAAGTLTTTVTGLDVAYSDRYTTSSSGGLSSSTAEKGTLVWGTSGTQITGTAKGYKLQVNRAVGGTLTLTNTGYDEAVLKFDYTFTDENDSSGLFSIDQTSDSGATISITSTASGTYEKSLARDESITITLISPKGETSNTLKLTNVSLVGTTAADATVTFTTAEGGSYTVDDTEITGETPYTAAAGAKYTLKATAASGYQFFGWYNATKEAYVSYAASETLTVTEDQTIYPVFVSSEVALFGVGAAKFTDLNAADASAADGSVKTIVLLNSGTITGDYTISAGNTLLIPYDSANTVHTEASALELLNETDGGEGDAPEWVKPNAYLTLTMAEGSSITVNGSLNVGGRQSPGNGSGQLTASSPSGDVGMIRMISGSEIILGDGANLYCWGYIYGGGTITAKSGATVHENFQFTDFRGGSATSVMASEYWVFPMTQYYVQNVEVATTFEYGAKERVWASVYMSKKIWTSSVDFIGEGAMFVPEEGASVTKTYIPGEDRLQIDIAGTSAINPMSVSMGGTAVDTSAFVLPITSNMTININSGTTTLNQSVALLPGVVLTVKENAVLSLAKGDITQKLCSQKGYLYSDAENLIIYDADQWLSGYVEVMDAETGEVTSTETVDAYFVHSGKRIQPLAYSPSRSYNRTEADLNDAVVDINGTLIADGFIYTTAGGASVISSAKTGRLVMNNGAGKDTRTAQVNQDGIVYTYVYLPMTSVQLQNADGTYLKTEGAAAGTTYNYCAKCNAWHAGEIPETVEINWVVNGEDGIVEVAHGEIPIYPGVTPTKASDGAYRYEFIGWSTSATGEALETLPAATADAVYFACFRAYLIGDLNLDGDVNAADMTLLARHVAGIESLSDLTALSNADVNGDGVINAEDLTLHAQYVNELISKWK